MPWGINSSKTDPVQFGFPRSVWDLFWPQDSSFQLTPPVLLSDKLGCLQFRLLPVVFPHIASVFESALRFELPHSLSQGRQFLWEEILSSLFYSLLLIPGRFSEPLLWSWGWGRWCASLCVTHCFRNLASVGGGSSSSPGSPQHVSPVWTLHMTSWTRLMGSHCFQNCCCQVRASISQSGEVEGGSLHLSAVLTHNFPLAPGSSGLHEKGWPPVPSWGEGALCPCLPQSGMELPSSLDFVDSFMISKNLSS